MKIKQFLADRGVPANAVDELISLLPKKMPRVSCAYFCDANSIMKSEKWFYWPTQTRFVLVGQCPNGDGIGIDTTIRPGTVHFISHERISRDIQLEDITVQVAASPQDYALKLLKMGDDFPMDYLEAKQKQTEP